MRPIANSQLVKAPPQRVFAAATDFPNLAERIPGIVRMEVLTQPPYGLGTRYRETRVMFGKEAAATMEVLAWDPPGAYVVGATEGGMQYRTEFTFTAEAGGTRVTMSIAQTPLTLGAKLMVPLGVLLTGVVKKAIAKHLAELAASAESRS